MTTKRTAPAAAGTSTKAPNKTKKRKKAAAAAPTATITTATTSIQRTLVIDNGGDTIKYGWSKSSTTKPARMFHVTARLAQQWDTRVGDQVWPPTSTATTTIAHQRSTERGIAVNMGNCIQVWKRILDVLHIVCQPNVQTAKVLGWKSTKKNNNNKNHDETIIAAATVAVLVTVPPYCPRIMLDQMAMIFLQDFGVGRIGFCTSSAVAARQQAATVVDVGWSACQIVCCASSFAGHNNNNNNNNNIHAVRRVPIGGRHLIKLLQYQTTYRQWHLMDQEWLLRTVLESCFVSSQFATDMDVANQLPPGRRPYDREVVLPDGVERFQAEIRLPMALQQKEKEEDEEKEEDNESEDDSFTEQDMKEQQEGDDAAANEQLDDDEEETREQLKQRLQQQKREEERRRRAQQAEQQILNLSVERFAIPECLFRPGDCGFPLNLANLPQAIVQAIEATPGPFRPAFYKSVRLVGGLSLLSGLKERLEQELRALVPCEYDLEISTSENPVDEAWYGACQLVNSKALTEWSISKREWEAQSRKVAWDDTSVSLI